MHWKRNGERVLGLLLALVAVPTCGFAATAANDPPPARALLLELCESTRLAGTSGSRIGARMVSRHLEKAGFQVELDEREVLLTYPRRVEFSIYADAWSEAPVRERMECFDPDARPPGDVPKYNAWSASGTVRALVVDAGYGQRADFERLKSLGVDVRGAIALVRYGKCYRGVKVDLAAQNGCAGVLLFDEASSDGSERGPVWPAGAWKPDWEAQRGSISPMGRIPGDPSTPGWPSPKPGQSGARRIAGEDLASSLPRIPCLPIGSREGQMLLARLAEVDVKDSDGNVKPQKIGPGPVQVRLALDMPRELRTIVSVIGRLQGASDDVVIAGAHRDAWVRGANDDGAGTVALLRAAAHLGERARAGERPANTILLGFWDAEEFGLIGSTEWAEANAAWLRERCVAYVNADVGVHGTKFRGATGSPGLFGTLERVLRALPAVPRAAEPQPATLWDEWVEAAGETGPRFSLPGSGSDFAAFVHHLNLPMLEVGFGGAAGGQYHTTFDDFAHVDRYIDPGFVGHEALGRVFDELLTELARAGRSSFDPNEAARELARLARAAGAEVGPGEVGGWLGAERAERLATSFDELANASGPIGSGRFYAALSVEAGVPSRPWYRNPLWTPGLEDGYGSETFPTLRAAAVQGTDELDAELLRMIESVRALRPKD